jgi:membrane protein
LSHRVQDLWARSRAFVDEGLWRADAAAGGPRLRRLLQLAVMTAEGFVRDRLLLRASALSYFTVLSMIPLLAVAISIVSAVGVGGDFAEMIVKQLAAGSPDTQARIVERIRNVNFAGLGTLGAVSLFVTTVLGISNVESALNAIWGVRQERTLARRFADYLAVLVVAPLLLATALSLATTLQSQWLVQKLFEYRIFTLLYDLGLRQAPTVVLAAAFAFLYWFLPNTRVRPLAAVLGGGLAAVLVVGAQKLYLGLNVGVVRYDALFGGFAALPLLFVWIYFFWAIALFGAEVAFAYDNLPHYRREVHGRPASPAEREAIGLRIALEVARAFRDAAPVWTADALSDALDVPVRSVRDVLSSLERAGIVAARGAVEKEGGFQLGRPAERIPVTAVIRALRGVRESAAGDPRVSDAVAAVLGELEAGAEKGVGERTLADLAAALPPREAR